MPDNGRKPVIAKGQVIAVLKAMTSTSGFKRSLYNCNELLELQVVQNIVNTATFPASTEATQFALEQIMKDIIQEHFLRLLKFFEITSPKLD